jgi:hypothetical protein
MSMVSGLKARHSDQPPKYESHDSEHSEKGTDPAD